MTTGLEPQDLLATCRSCRSSEDVIWHDDLVQVRVGGPIGLPYVARVVPRAHLADRDLDAATRRRIVRVLRRITAALRADAQVADVEITDTGSAASHLQVVVLARPLPGTYDPATPLALLDDLLPTVHPDTVLARTERVVAALSRARGRRPASGRARRRPAAVRAAGTARRRAELPRPRRR